MGREVGSAARQHRHRLVEPVELEQVESRLNESIGVRLREAFERRQAFGERLLLEACLPQQRGFLVPLFGLVNIAGHCRRLARPTGNSETFSRLCAKTKKAAPRDRLSDCS